MADRDEERELWLRKSKGVLASIFKPVSFQKGMGEKSANPGQFIRQNNRKIVETNED